jgi:hypothetical protein
MNGRDLLFAVAGADEAFIEEARQGNAVREQIEAERKRKRRAVFAVCAAAAVCAAVVGLMRFSPWRTPAVIPPAISDGTEAPTGPTPVTEPTAVTEPVATWEEAPSAEPTNEPTTLPPASGEETTQPEKNEPAGETSPPGPAETDPPEETQTQPGTANAVFTDLIADYETAKEKFGHPIRACADGDFVNYRVGIVSKNGDTEDPGAFCLSVTYVFAHGSVALQDQDRLPGNAYNPWGERCDYRDRVFYVDPPEYAGDVVRVSYYPGGENGIAYQALFEQGTDVYEIMDKIIGVEV